MLFKIGWRSFLRQFRNYMVYFICMMTAVMIFYSFNALMNDRLLNQRVQQDIRIEGVLGFGSSVVAFVVLFFMLSANHFFLSQRQKEISVYQLLGLRQGRLAWLLLRETFLLNFFSLVTGIFMGIIFSKFFSMILIRAMGLNLTSHFFNSPQSIFSTVFVFIAAMIILSIQVILFVWRTPMSELIKTEYRLPIKKMKMTPFRTLMGVLGLILLGVGYYLSLTLRETWTNYITYTQDFSAILWIPLLILFCCITATYLFFDCSLPALLYFLSKPKKRLIKGAKLIAYNNVRAYLQRTWKSYALLTIITAIAISLIGGTMGVISLNYQATNRIYPTSFQVSGEQAGALRTLLKKSDVPITAEQAIPYKMTNMTVQTRYLGELQDESVENMMVNLVALSDYQRLRKLVPGAPEIRLSTDKQAVLFDSQYDVTRSFITYRDEVKVGSQHNFKLIQAEQDYFGDSALRYSLPNVLVIQDEAYQQIKGFTYTIAYLQTEKVRIVRTAKDQSINLAFLQIFQIAGGNHFRYRIIHPAFFHERDEKRTGRSDDVNRRIDLLNRAGIYLAGDGSFGSDDTDLLVFRRQHRTGGAGADNAQNRNVKFRPDSVKSIGACGITGDDDRLYVFRQKKADDLLGIAGYGLFRLTAVRYAGGITEVDDIFVRKLPHDLAGNGETADAGIKDADRGFSRISLCHR